MKKFKHILLAALMLTSTLCCAGCGEQLKEEDIPDYSAYTHQFDFYAYHSAHDGYYYVDYMPTYVGESFMTKEQYQLYKDAGMNIFYPQSILKINAESDQDEMTREQCWERAKAGLPISCACCATAPRFWKPSGGRS